MAKEILNFTILYGSYRSERLGIRAVKYLESQLQQRGHQTTFIDAKEQNLPILDKMYKEYCNRDAQEQCEEFVKRRHEHAHGINVPETLSKLAKIYENSDAIVVVTGEYNHSIQPGLKNLMDYFMEEYFFKPSVLVSYSPGIFGGMRAAVHLRAILGELGMPSIPSILGISKIHEVLDEQGNDVKQSLAGFMPRFIDEMEWYARAFKNERSKGTPY